MESHLKRSFVMFEEDECGRYTDSFSQSGGGDQPAALQLQATTGVAAEGFAHVGTDLRTRVPTHALGRPMESRHQRSFTATVLKGIRRCTGVVLVLSWQVLIADRYASLTVRPHDIDDWGMTCVITVVRWTGREARALRQARRMSVRAFAAHLGVAVASVANWEQRGTAIRLRHDTQEILDRDLLSASDDVRTRFEADLGGVAVVGALTSAEALHPLHALAHADADMAHVARSGWDETVHALLVQWRLLVDNDKLFGPAYALVGVSQQLNFMNELLGEAPESFRPMLCRLAAQYSESAAWLSQSLDDDAAAGRFSRRALDLATRTGDTAMIAWARYRSSQHWLTRKATVNAVKVAEAAVEHDTALPAPMRAAIRVQQAHALAAAGHHDHALRLMDQAHRWAADRNSGKPEGEHASFCTSGYIEVYRGACLQLANRPREAVAVLDAALPSIPRLHRQDYASALLTKAVALASAQEPEASAATAHTALPIARRTDCRRLLRRLGELGSSLKPYQHLTAVSAYLDDLVGPR